VAAAPSVPLTTAGLLRFGSVRNLLSANLVMYTGVALQAAALGKQAYDITGREADLGWIGLCEFLPAALLVLVTGTVADRFNRKKVALIAIAGESLTSVALLIYAHRRRARCPRWLPPKVLCRS
jgi:MFS family permease